MTALPGLAAVIALIFASLSIRATNAQLQITEQGQITDRYNAAIANLGSPSVDVRLGGIYALQRIMQDSPRDQPTVVAVLCAFVRDHASGVAKSAHASAGHAFPISSHLPTDIQASLTVVGTRASANDGTTTIVDFTNADLSGADLSGAVLANAHLSGVDLSQADLSGADLSSADLENADVRHAALTKADLRHANLKSANLSNAELVDAFFSYAILFGTDLSYAHLDNANFRNSDIIYSNFSDVSLNRADFTYANIFRTSFDGAFLAGAKGLPSDTIKGS